MSAPATTLPEAAPRRPDRSFIDGTWELFTSPRFTVVLLWLLVFACALGTFVNADKLPATELRAAIGHEWWYPTYRFFELDDLFHSWWFGLLVVLLALGLLASAIGSFPRVFGVAPGPAKRLDLAAWVVKLSVLLILGGALLSRSLGMEGVVSVPMDGGTFDYVLRRTAGGSPFKEPLGFTVRVASFRLLKFANGGLRSLESDLEVLDPVGKPIRRQTIQVGKPLTFRGWTFSQGSFEEEPGRDLVKLAVTDLKGGGPAKIFQLGKDGEATLPDGVRFHVEGYSPDFAQLGPAVQIARLAPDGAKTSFWVFEKYPEFDAKNRGDKYGLRFDGVDPFYFTNLRAGRDPGFPVWLAGGCLLLLGLALGALRKVGL